MEIINDVPSWLPVLSTILGGIAFAWRKVWPIVEEMWEAAKLARLDNYIGDGVAHLMETEVKDINAKIADGRLTKEQGKELLVNLGKNFLQEVVTVFGKAFLKSGDTETVAARKLEATVGRLKVAKSMKSVGDALGEQ